MGPPASVWTISLVTLKSVRQVQRSTTRSGPFPYLVSERPSSIRSSLSWCISLSGCMPWETRDGVVGFTTFVASEAGFAIVAFNVFP